MICRSCGREISNEAKFCPHCGMDPMVPIGSGDLGAPGPSASTGPEAPAGGGKKKTGLLIGGAVAAVAVIALVAAAVTGLFANPKGQVEKAMVKSIAAYAAAEERLGMPDVSRWQRDQSVSQHLALELTGLNSSLTGYDLDALAGLGLRMDASYDGGGRQMFFDLGACWGEDDLLSFQMAADDSEMYFRIPQFTGETYYGVNTETLGADLTEMTGDDSMEDVSFNLFELAEITLDRMDAEAMERSIAEANRALWEAAGVKKAGARTLDLNGTSVKTTLYHVTIPQDALEGYVDDIMDVMAAIDYSQLYGELFRSMGMPEEEVRDFLDDLEDLDPYGELAGLLKDALEDFGDLELDVCLSGGYISAILYTDEIGGADVELALYLGGGGEYVDDLSAALTVNSTEITLESSGDHGLKSGVYTDKTTIQFRQPGVNTAKITSELSYAPEESGDNLQWELDVNGSGLSLFTLEARGSLAAGPDAFSLALEDISLRMMGMEVCSLLFDYSASAAPEPLELGAARLITEMSTAELMTFATQLERSASAWAADMQALFASRLPAELLYGMMY